MVSLISAEDGLLSTVWYVILTPPFKSNPNLIFEAAPAPVASTPNIMTYANAAILAMIKIKLIIPLFFFMLSPFYSANAALIIMAHSTRFRCISHPIS